VEFTLQEAKNLVHNQEVQVKVADGQYAPARIQGYPKITPTAVYLDILTQDEFRMKVHYSFLRKKSLNA